MHRDRNAFTIIELMLVFSLIAILTGMSALGVARTLQRSGVNQATSSLRDVATQAQLLAVNAPTTSDRTTYGVVIAYDETRRCCFACVIKAHDGDGKAMEADRLLDGQRRNFPPNAVVWIGDRELSSYSTEVAWYYQCGTGLPMARVDGKLCQVGATVGLPAVSLTTTSGKPIFGARVGMTVPAVATSADGIPGLSFRSRDQQLRLGIAVYASGTLAVADF